MPLAAALVAAGCSMLSPDKTSDKTPPSPASVVPPEVLDASVTQQNAAQTICTEGHAARVRASDATLNAIRRRLVEEAAMTDGTLYDLVPRVPLELGGSASSVRNYVLQPWDLHATLRPRQRLVLTLQRLVCSGQVTLADAQAAMYVDWRAAYSRYVKE